MSHIM